VLIELRAERPFVGRSFGTLIDDRALLTRERRLLVVGFEEVLPNLGADQLEQETQVADDRVVPQHRTLLLERVVHAEQRQPERCQCRQRPGTSLHPVPGERDGSERAQAPCEVAHRDEPVHRAE
jgi:hypothetical protein